MCIEIYCDFIDFIERLYRAVASKIEGITSKFNLLCEFELQRPHLSSALAFEHVGK